MASHCTGLPLYLHGHLRLHPFLHLRVHPLLHTTLLHVLTSPHLHNHMHRGLYQALDLLLVAQVCVALCLCSVQATPFPQRCRPHLNNT